MDRARRPLVFEDSVMGKTGRTVDQNRYHIQQIPGLLPGDVERQEHFRVAMSSRASATLVSSTPPWVVDNDACVQGSGSSVSSGVLVTDFHALTAAHFTQSIPGEPPTVEVGFDGVYALVSNDFFEYSGYWAADDANPAAPFTNTYPGAWEETLNARWGDPEETPFLVNRLFQLGLGEWTSDDPAVEDLRRLLHRRFQAQVHDPFTSLKDRDIAFVEFSVDRWDSFETILDEFLGHSMPTPQTGRFSLRSPAPFYNRLQMPSSDEEDIRYQVDRTKEMWGLHSNEWPGDESEDKYHATVVSREARVEPEWTHIDEGEDCDADGNLIAHNYEVVLSSIDSLVSSSGGGVYGCAHPECKVPGVDNNWYDQSETDVYAPTLMKGIISASFWDDPEETDHWEEPGDFRYDQNDPSGSRATGVSLLTPAVVETIENRPIIDYETGQTLIAHMGEVFIETTDRPDLLKCTRYEADDISCNENSDCASGICEGEQCMVCAEFNGQGIEDNLFGSAPDVDFVVDSPGAPGPTNNGLGEPVSAHNEGAQRQETNCQFVGPSPDYTVTDGDGNQVSPTAMLGFRGGMMTNGPGNEHSVGTLRPVCGPWTGHEYTDNWRHLYTNGPFIHNDSWQTSRHPIRLHEAELSEWELNYFPRPVSMKLCPPNTLLRGVKVIIDADPEGAYIAGFTDLVCLGVNSRAGASKIEVPLESNVSMTIGGDPFPLTQRIGDPTWNGSKTATIECKKSRQVVYRIVTVHSDDKKLRELYLGCLPSPYQP